MARNNKKDLRNFGYIWVIIFLTIGLSPVIHFQGIRLWALVIAFIFLVISALKTTLLSRFYVIWIKTADFIGGIISRIIIFFLYFGIFTPVALFLKLLGKDLLNKQLDKSISSYWIEREIQPQSMKNQF